MATTIRTATGDDLSVAEDYDDVHAAIVAGWGGPIQLTVQLNGKTVTVNTTQIVSAVAANEVSPADFRIRT